MTVLERTQQEKDDIAIVINHHYKKIIEYQKISGNNFDLSSKISANSHKARSKLSNLSNEQFSELSTDVHDELQRRINENIYNETKQNYLKPNAKYHNKRNQARQKLSSLSQQRFDDLLKDIMTEIEKRGYHEILQSNSVDVNNISDETESFISNLQSKKEDTIQQTVIVPVKASIDWSDDDEEQGDEDEYNNINENAPDSTNIFSKIDNVELNNEVLKKEVTINPKNKIERHVLELDDSLLNDGDTTISSDLSNDDEIKTTDINYSSKNDINRLSKENEQLKRELNILKETKMSSNFSTEDEFSQIELNTSEYTSNNGHIPMSLVEKFKSTLQYFYELVNSKESLRKETLSRKLFSQVFEMSKIVSDAFLLVDVAEFRNEVVLVKTSLSQLITSVRYYCSFISVLPKIVINSAGSDLAFSFCTLLKVAGIKSITVSENVSNTVAETVECGNVAKTTLESPVKTFRLAEKLREYENTAKVGTETSTGARFNPNKSFIHDIMDVKSGPTTDLLNEKKSIKSINMIETSLC